VGNAVVFELGEPLEILGLHGGFDDHLDWKATVPICPDISRECATKIIFQ
jgi:hypothetical protein